MESRSAGRVPIQRLKGCVVASIQIDLTEETLQLLRDDLLRFLNESGATGVILDVSGVEVMDLDDFNALRATMSAATLMGARTMIAGIKPGVASAIIDLGADTEGLEAALNLNEAFRLLTPAEAEVDPVDDDDDNNDDGAEKTLDGRDTETAAAKNELGP